MEILDLISRLHPASFRITIKIVEIFHILLLSVIYHNLYFVDGDLEILITLLSAIFISTP